MNSGDTYDRLKVNELKAELKRRGQSTKGNKSTLIHRLRYNTGSVDGGGSEGERSLDTEINRAPAIALPILSKEKYDQMVQGNAIFDWTLAILNTREGLDAEDIPMDIKLLTDNHPDISVIRNVLMVIAAADISPQKKPSPTETIERLKTIITNELATVEVVHQRTAEMLKKLGINDDNIRVQGMLTAQPHMDAALDAVQQAIMSWVFTALRGHDESIGSTFPDSFSSSERIELRKWGRKWIKDNDVNPSELSDDQINAALADPEIPNARVKENLACVRAILRQICSELRRDVKAKAKRQDAKRDAAGLDGEEEGSDGSEAAAEPKKRGRVEDKE